mmetsp:Transcript_21807/g.70404  ORF Transcript_21807/g.70404 Transcript_21807/m.70404 type:complete len:246 (+) Transcript_21807:404-1141(+)
MMKAVAWFLVGMCLAATAEGGREVASSAPRLPSTPTAFSLSLLEYAGVPESSDARLVNNETILADMSRNSSHMWCTGELVQGGYHEEMMIGHLPDGSGALFIIGSLDPSGKGATCQVTHLSPGSYTPTPFFDFPPTAAFIRQEQVHGATANRFEYTGTNGETFFVDFVASKSEPVVRWGKSAPSPPWYIDVVSLDPHPPGTSAFDAFHDPFSVSCTPASEASQQQPRFERGALARVREREGIYNS